MKWSAVFLAAAILLTLYSLGFNIEQAKAAKETVVTAEPQPPRKSSSVDNTTRVPRFWVPTGIAHVEHGDPRVTLCRLDFDSYWRNPSKTPMFRDLVAASRCGKEKSGSLNELVEDLKRRGQKPLMPTGFVFHESRVGSTLIANMLGSNPKNLVYSESAPPPAVINHCDKCGEERRNDILRKLVALMGASPYHDRLFFKFQSITVPNIAVIASAFPATPWIFLYREPVQVMMSHFKRGPAARSAPCLREHRRPRKATADILAMDAADAASVSVEQYCAAHLAMLCKSALDLPAPHNGLMVDYDSLPGSLVHYILPSHFGVPLDRKEADVMLQTATVYSKRRKPVLPKPGDAPWETDSQAKEDAATENIRRAADQLMRPLYARLQDATKAKTGGDDLLRYKNRSADE